MSLLGPNGQPISSANYAKKTSTAPNPVAGEIAASWAGVNHPPSRFPMENSLQFDTSRLTLNDFRMMRDHYQINSSITVLTFMLHQIEWKIECDNIKIAKHCEDNLNEIWTRLVRALSQAFIFGFSPNALQWENDKGNGRLVVTKVKDLRPEDCAVHWKEIQAKSRKQFPHQHTPKVKIYDGIDQPGWPTIPVENSLWYPLLMENGNFYGKKLLKAAFQPWFFSSLIHFYSNRYFERFGEPVVVSRAPFDEKVDIGGNNEIQGNLLMAGLNNMVRNGSSVVLPNTKAMNGLDGVGNYEYTMEYLESQMRGADFERYLTRLDQEISLALFTPLLMMNTADGGSFNLGIVHTQMYLGMINAIASDWKEYIDKYLLRPMAIQNFGPNAKLPKLRFRRLGQTDKETTRAILAAVLGDGQKDGTGVKVDLEELGQEVGLTLTQIDEIVQPESQAINEISDKKVNKPAEITGKRRDTRVGRPEREQTGKGLQKKGSVSNLMADRVSHQFCKALRDDVAPQEFSADPGYMRQLREFMPESEVDDALELVRAFSSEFYELMYTSDEQLESEIRAMLRSSFAGLIGAGDAG